MALLWICWGAPLSRFRVFWLLTGGGWVGWLGALLWWGFRTPSLALTTLPPTIVAIVVVVASIVVGIPLIVVVVLPTWSIRHAIATLAW